MPTRMQLPTHDRTLTREVCAAAMFGGVNLMAWTIEVMTTAEEGDVPLHTAARMANAERGIACDDEPVTDDQRKALRAGLDAAIAGALGGRSGIVDRDVEAVLAMPRDSYSGVDTALCRDLVAILWGAWQRADRATLEVARCG